MLPSLVIMAITVLVSACGLNDNRAAELRTFPLSVSNLGSSAIQAIPGETITVMTLNLAHGRKDSINQWMLSSEEIHENLDTIARYLKQSNVDVVALQEADSPSSWSGDFNHVAYLAEKSGYQYFVHTPHAQMWMANYGTAIMSRWPISNARGLTYASTPPTPSKGFTMAQILWRNSALDEAAVPIDVISIHLDFSRKSVRRQQVEELGKVIGQRTYPLIIMGDFNSEWLAEDYLIQNTADSSKLHTFHSTGADLTTYKDKRLDWILADQRLDFSSYQVEQEVLSDHKAIIATLFWRKI
ncbi:MAG: endonuclease/exonuclease/phosphatase family protein [Halioglobus sp.]